MSNKKIVDRGSAAGLRFTGESCAIVLCLNAFFSRTKRKLVADIHRQVIGAMDVLSD